MTLGRNLLSGLAGSVATAAIGLLVVPLYVRYLGVEAYGLIGFFATTQALLQILDLGLSPTLSREVARARAQGDLAPARRLLHTLAAFYWATGGVLFLALAALSPLIARHWLNAQALSPEALARALALMGLIIGARWPTGLYLGALVGAERLTVASGLGLASTALGNLGAVAVLAFVSPTLDAFFLWQAGVGLLYAAAMRRAAWGVLGREGARLDLGAVREVWRFSAAVGAVGMVGLALSQLDKVLLSRLLPLADFGRYMVASTLAGGLYVFVLPLFNGVYPRFSNLVARGDEAGLAALYRTATRLLGTGLFPLAMLLAAFGEDLLLAWTRDAALARATAPTLALLAAGTALHGAMHVPYALQLAYGKARLALGLAASLLALMAGLLALLAPRLGAAGGGLSWLLVHATYLLAGTALTARALPVSRGATWLLREVGVPLALAAVVGLAGRWLLAGAALTLPVRVACDLGFALLACGLSFAVSGQLRTAVLENLKR